MEMTKRLPLAEAPIDGKRQSPVAHACAGGYGETAAVVRTVGGYYQQRIAADSLAGQSTRAHLRLAWRGRHLGKWSVEGDAERLTLVLEREPRGRVIRKPDTDLVHMTRSPQALPTLRSMFFRYFCHLFLLIWRTVSCIFGDNVRRWPRSLRLLRTSAARPLVPHYPTLRRSVCYASLASD